MIYTIDTILAKIYFKIHETGDLRLLTNDEKVTQEELESIWEEIVEQDQDKNQKTQRNKGFNLSKKIQRLSSKYSAISKALFVLKYKRDEDLEKIVKSFNYNLTDNNFHNDVIAISKNIKIIYNKIEGYKQQLEELFPKEKEEKKASGTFEDTLMSYYVILGISVKDANTITLLEFRGLQKQVKAKLEALEKQNNGR